MATGKYDILVQLHEKVLNKGLAMLFYSGKLKKNGKFVISPDLPPEVDQYITFEYEIYPANEPFVDLRYHDKDAPNTLFLRFNTALNLVVLSGIRISFIVDFYVKSWLEFSLSKKLEYKLFEVKIIRINVLSKVNAGKDFLKRLNYIISQILEEYFINDLKTIDIPVALNGLDLPMMPPGDDFKLPVSGVDVKILDKKIVMAGISFFHTNGSLEGLTDLTGNRECYIAIRVQALQEIINFWWENTTWDKQQDFDKNELIGFSNALARGVDIATRLATLGLLQSETEYDDMILNYGGLVSLEKQPVLTFIDGDRVEVTNLEFIADVFGNLFADVKKDLDLDTSSFIPDKITPWEDDINLKKFNKKKKLLKLKKKFSIHVNNAEGCLKINEKNNLAVKITKADFEIRFRKNSRFSKRTWEKLVNFLKNSILEKIPEIIVSPSLIMADKNIFGFTLGLSGTSLNISGQEIEITTDVIVNEFQNQSIAVPEYVADSRLKVIHFFECDHVKLINRAERVGYHVVYEALADNYQACKRCLSYYYIEK